MCNLHHMLLQTLTLILSNWYLRLVRHPRLYAQLSVSPEMIYWKKRKCMIYLSAAMMKMSLLVPNLSLEYSLQTLMVWMHKVAIYSSTDSKFISYLQELESYFNKLTMHFMRVRLPGCVLWSWAVLISLSV